MSHRDHFVYAPSQMEDDVVKSYTKWTLVSGVFVIEIWAINILIERAKYSFLIQIAWLAF